MGDATARRALPARTDARTARARRWFGPRPDVGVGTAGKAVAEDLSALVKAEIALAKAELAADVKAKARGPIILAGAGAMAWLGLQGLLVTAALAVALVLPGWAAALVVTGVVLLAAGVLALAGRRAIRQAPQPLAATKENVREDVAWIRSRLARR